MQFMNYLIEDDEKSLNSAALPVLPPSGIVAIMYYGYATGAGALYEQIVHEHESCKIAAPHVTSLCVTSLAWCIFGA